MMMMMIKIMTVMMTMTSCQHLCLFLHKLSRRSLGRSHVTNDSLAPAMLRSRCLWPVTVLAASSHSGSWHYPRLDGFSRNNSTSVPVNSSALWFSTPLLIMIFECANKKWFVNLIVTAWISKRIIGIGIFG